MFQFLTKKERSNVLKRTRTYKQQLYLQHINKYITMNEELNSYADKKNN